MLCEEITKCLNSRYEVLKEQDVSREQEQEKKEEKKEAKEEEKEDEEEQEFNGSFISL